MEQRLQRRISALRLGLEIDEQRKLGTIGIDAAAISARSVAERFKIKSFQGALGSGLHSIVSDEELTVDQVNVRFDATKAVVEGVQKRARMFVVVVCVGPAKWGCRSAVVPAEGREVGYGGYHTAHGQGEY
jgi:hypothetical protein